MVSNIALRYENLAELPPSLPTPSTLSPAPLSLRIREYSVFVQKIAL